MDSAYLARVTALHRALGLPSDYASHGLPLQPEADPAALETIATTADGRPIQLLPSAARAWRELHAAAASASISLVPLSGFRSVARQAEIVRRHLARGRSLDDLLRYVAAPGYSEHHTGCALDLDTLGASPLTVEFAVTEAFAWLDRHACTFGFCLSYPHGTPGAIAYEPWHWRWHPASPTPSLPGTTRPQRLPHSS